MPDPAPVDEPAVPDAAGAAEPERPRGLFMRRPGGGGSVGGALSGGFSALDAVFNPGAARARAELEQQHERVVATPSPGDRLLDSGRIVIELPDPDQPC